MTTAIKPRVRLDDLLIGAGLIGGGANVIMQLALPPVGHGVSESKVESGQLFRHPIKRSRTTNTYLSVALLGTPAEKKAFTRAVNRSHAKVRSDANSPVAYNAFDPDLQLWVAACLWRGFEDAYHFFGKRPLTDEEWEHLYQEAATLGTTLQVPPQRWPADRAAFEDYWKAGMERISIDDRVRGYLYDVVMLRFLPRMISAPLGPVNKFFTIGFLPPQFRTEMRMSWSTRDQRRFDRAVRAIAAIARSLPTPIRKFPFNTYMWDVRRRIRTGQPLV
ncbi:oxygenase MpaB family protein [Fodinicola feengrottensis]|uniref:Oxygenase MpaB family protein n=1 Tax=Fodinicola feengrottensis TaxID=435914 RepID=A0ABN2G3D4_9ACTN|nr:oxygenase MpaB family protein [Fodinicola feengrottensis]